MLGNDPGTSPSLAIKNHDTVNLSMSTEGDFRKTEPDRQAMRKNSISSVADKLIASRRSTVNSSPQESKIRQAQGDEEASKSAKLQRERARRKLEKANKLTQIRGGWSTMQDYVMASEKAQEDAHWAELASQNEISPEFLEKTIAEQIKDDSDDELILLIDERTQKQHELEELLSELSLT